jgi:hypothetical protein
MDRAKIARTLGAVGTIFISTVIILLLDGLSPPFQQQGGFYYVRSVFATKQIAARSANAFAGKQMARSGYTP